MNQACNALAEAHQANLEETFTSFEPQTSIKKDALELNKIVKTDAERLRMRAARQLEEIEQLANYPDQAQLRSMDETKRHEVIAHRLRQHGAQSALLTFRDPLLKSLLSRDDSLISERNPFLSESMIEELKRKTLEYLDCMNQVNQAEAAIPLLESALEENNREAFSRAVAILAHERRYDLQSDPEIALYEYASSQRLRPEQIKILRWMIENGLEGQNAERTRQLAFEFQAGGGKTKVLSAIMAARAQSEGKVPIFFSIPHLEEVTQEDLRESLMLNFERKLSRVHFSINSEIKLEDITKLIELFQLSLQEKRTLFLSPETWHALNLARIGAIRAGNQAFVDEIGKLFDLFKTKGVALIDEGHVNADSLHETNKASGAPLSIPSKECTLFATVAYHLARDPELKEKVKLIENKQSSMLATEWPAVRSRLAELLCTSFEDTISSEHFNDLKEYWLNPNAERCGWMDELLQSGQQPLVKRIDLVRGLLNEMLPFTLSLSREIDYQPSKIDGEEIWIPAQQGIASGAHFQHADVTALVTAQASFQTGLTLPQLNSICEQYTTTFNLQIRSGIPSGPIEATWKKILQEAHIAEKDQFTLGQYSRSTVEERASLLEKVAPQLRSHLGLIQEYLTDKVLPQIAIYPEVEQSTASHLIESFETAILFSATLGGQERYPLVEEPEITHKRDVQFIDQVVSRAVLPHNQKMHWQKDSTPDALVESLDRKEFSEVEGIINAGAFCENATSEEWADAFLKRARNERLDKKAALFFKTDENGARSLWLKIAEQPPKMHLITGSNIRQVFKDFGLKEDQVYKIFAPAETTGTDFPTSANGRMLLTIAHNVNLSLAVQAIMRMRGFLNDPISENNAQKISWVGSLEFQKRLKEASPDNKNLSPHAFFRYALQTEVEKDKAAITQQAFQEIEAVLVREMEQSHNDISSHAYYKAIERDPSRDYGGANRSVPLNGVLREHAEAFARRCGFEALNSVSQKAKAAINAIIDRASKVVPLTSKRQTTPLSAKVEQKAIVEEKQDQKKRNVQSKNRPLFEHSYRPYQESIFDGPILHTLANNVYSPSVWQQNFFSQDLFFLSNALAKFKNNQVSSSESPPETDALAIIPATMLLIEEIDGETRAFAISDQDGIDFIHQMTSCGNLNRKRLCIVTTSGELVHNNQESEGGFSDEGLASLKNSAWMKEILCEINFWNGRIIDYEWLQGKLNSGNPEQRERTIEVWNWIRQHHVNPKHVQNKLFNFALRSVELSEVEAPEVTSLPRQESKPPPSSTPTPTKAKLSSRQRVRHLWKTKRWFKAATVLSLGMGWLIAWGHYARTNKKKS